MISEKNDRAEGSSSCSNSAKSMSQGTKVDLGRLTFGVLITQSILPHVCKLDCALRTGIHEPVAALRMEFGGGDDFSEFLHISRLDVHDVEALILNIEVPQVYAEIIAADESLSIRIDGYAVDVIGMGICIIPTRYCGDYSVVMG